MLPVEERLVIVANTQTSRDTSRLQPNLNDRRRLLLYFDDESWADVRDRYDARPLYQSVGKGRVILLEGEPPLQVFLDNSTAVRVQYNGSFTEFEPDASGLAARFSVSENPQ